MSTGKSKDAHTQTTQTTQTTQVMEQRDKLPDNPERDKLHKQDEEDVQRDKLHKLAQKLCNSNDTHMLADGLILCAELEDHELSKILRRNSLMLARTGDSDAGDTYWGAVKFDARTEFDSYIRYMEKNRPVDKQFYYGRRKSLTEVVRQIQRLIDDELDILAVSLPPGTGKSTLEIFLVSYLAGRNSQSPILMASHNNSFLRGVYDELLRMMDANGEYLWHDIFPGMGVIRTDAKDLMIDVGRDLKDGQRFGTIEFGSVEAGLAGKVRCEQLLCCDDLVSGLEQALSRTRMDSLWNAYSVNLRQRKLVGCKELHVCTRWSVHDVVGRLENMYGSSDRAEFLRVSALDENDHSNFTYFTDEFFKEQREIMDDASWRALYMNEPIEREGQLYNLDELKRFYELPDTEPDAILAVCDTKDKGKDYCVMPIVYQYGNEFYLEDVICDNSNPEIVEERLVQKLDKHKVQLCRFESNSAGGHIAGIVQSKVKWTKISTKYTTSNKETKIIVRSPWVKDHVLFKDGKLDKEYKVFLNQLCGYTMVGKNEHDDAPDAMAMFAEYVESLEGSKVTVVDRRW